MNEHFSPDPIPPPEPSPRLVENAPPRRFGFAPTLGLLGVILAWLGIIGAVGYLVADRQLRPGERQGSSTDRLALVVHLIQSRYLVGSDQLLKALAPAGAGEFHEKATELLEKGTVDQRLRSVAVIGELMGPDAALQQLRELRRKADDADVRLSPAQLRTVAVLRRLYHDFQHSEFSGPSASAEDRDLLREQLGWFGDLALAPAGSDEETRAVVLRPAWRTAFAFLSTITIVAGLTFLGLFGLVALAVLGHLGRLRGGLRTGGGHGGVYAETFALWMLLFVGLSFGASLLNLPSAARLPVQGVAMLSSLVALLWPVLRGVPWSVVRHDIGWTTGRNPALEPLLGPVCYVTSLPLAAVGLVGTLLLAKLLGGLPGVGWLADAGEFAAPDTAAHPAIGIVANGSWLDRLAVLAVAAGVAPIVEETMFRGVLHRHLRELTGFARPLVSGLLSATVASFIFAVIHPQGLVGVPVLMGLAYGFTVAREWRETLIPAMVAHGLNNGLLLCLLMFILGG